MKRIFVASLVGLVMLSGCQKNLSSDSRLNEEKPSSSAPAVPEDLYGIVADFNAAVSDSESLEEYSFYLDITSLGNIEPFEATKYILKSTAEEAFKREYVIEKLSVEELVGFSSTTDKESFEMAMKTLMGSQNYFCVKYKNIDTGIRDDMGGAQFDELCKVETRSILEKIAARKLPVYMVHFVGNCYGDFEAVELWIGSEKVKGTFARISFDLVHEI